MSGSRMWSIAAALAGAAAVWCGAALAADLSTPHRAIEGIWRLDPALSDNPSKMPPQGGPGGRAPHGMSRPSGPPPGEARGPGGGARRGGMLGERDDRPSPADSVALLRGGPLWRLRNPARQVVVFVVGEQVEFTEDERVPLEFSMQDSLDAHGREAERPLGVARWKDGRLVAQSTIGYGRWLIETYEVSPDGSLLTVRARAEGGPESAPAPELKRVYRRYEGE